MRRRKALFLVAFALVAIRPGDLSAQAAGMPQLPEVDPTAAWAVERALWFYYHFSTEDDLRISPYPGLCLADQGDLCFEGDWESDCRLLLCHSPKARERFLLRLEGLARKYPHSPFAVGQAVAAAIRLNQPELALELVEICDPEGPWWCDILRGYALHRSHRSSQAMEPLRRGLEAAPGDLRCRLEDVYFLLPGDVRDRYDGIPCSRRAVLLRHFWWLSDPFLADPGNDRWAEHVSRRFELLLHEHRLQAMRVGGGRPGIHTKRRERYHVMRGPPDSWVDGVPGGGYLTGKKAASTHYVPERLSLEGLDGELSYKLQAGELDEAYTRIDGATSPIPAQIARFRQCDSLGNSPGDSLVVALASDLSGAGFWASDSSSVGKEEGPDGPMRTFGIGRAHFVASRAPGLVTALEPQPIRERLTFAATLAPGPHLVGLEVLTPGGTARHRAAIAPLETTDPALSDLLLFLPRGPHLPETRMGAVGMMLPSMVVNRERPLGVYMEGYGIDPTAEIRVEISLEPQDGLLGRLGRALGLKGDARSFQWTEAAGDTTPFRRAVTLRLGGVDPGAYDLKFEMTLPGGTVLARAVQIQIVDDG